LGSAAENTFFDTSLNPKEEKRTGSAAHNKVADMVKKATAQVGQAVGRKLAQEDNQKAKEEEYNRNKGIIFLILSDSFLLLLLRLACTLPIF
jgi:hypothetical protein